MYILEVLFRIPCTWINMVKGEILYMNCRPWSSYGIKVFLMVKGRISTDSMGKARVRVSSVENLDEETSLSIIRSDSCPCRLAGLSNTHILSAKVAGDKIRMKIITESRGEARSILQSMRSAGISIIEYSVRKASPKDFLTSRQRDVLISALNSGYYNIPKKTSIKDIATSFGISKPRAWELLRQGVSKLISKAANGEIV